MTYFSNESEMIRSVVLSDSKVNPVFSGFINSFSWLNNKRYSFCQHDYVNNYKPKFKPTKTCKKPVMLDSPTKNYLYSHSE